MSEETEKPENTDDIPPTVAVPGFVDKYLGRFVSRKLLITGIATWLLLAERLNGEQWAAVAIGYVGLQGFADLAAVWKHGKRM